ncbi:MAG TPA: rRNA adenine N-6-methyltransferase family protein, partial [Solirubrobacterales bacterium]
MVRLGQNFLADPNLLEAIVRDAELSADDVVLEVGAGEGVLTERLSDALSPLRCSLCAN